MTEEVIYINDPLGRTICITKNFCWPEKEIDALDLLEDLSSVINKPALLIETSGSPTEYLYFRTIGWHHSVLIHVKYTHDFWEAYKCHVNPSDADIVELLRNGRQLI